MEAFVRPSEVRNVYKEMGWNWPNGSLSMPRLANVTDSRDLNIFLEYIQDQKTSLQALARKHKISAGQATRIVCKTASIAGWILSYSTIYHRYQRAYEKVMKPDVR